MDAIETANNPARRPRLTLVSAVMFVADLDRSVVSYQDLVGLEATTRSDEAALLVRPDGYQLDLRSRGKRAQHFTGAIGIQYLVWTAEHEEDLQRCERVLKAQSPQVTRTTVEGFRMVEGRGPDDVPVRGGFPGPDQIPRHEILQRIYAW